MNMPAGGSRGGFSLGQSLTSKNAFKASLSILWEDYIVSELQRSPGKEMKQAARSSVGCGPLHAFRASAQLQICKAVIAAGPAAAAFYHADGSLLQPGSWMVA